MSNLDGKASEAAGLIHEVAEWIGDRRGGEAPEAALSQLTRLSDTAEFRKAFGILGEAFVYLANARDFLGANTPAERTALAALALLLLERAA